MKISKKTALTLTAIVKTGGHVDCAQARNVIKLKGVTMAEREKLRIPSYKYILP